MIRVRSFRVTNSIDEQTLDASIQTWLEDLAIQGPVDISIQQSSYNTVIVIVCDLNTSALAASQLEAAKVISGPVIKEVAVRVQAFQAEAGGGNLWDFTQTDSDLTVVHVRITTAVPIALNLFFGDPDSPNLIDRLHIIPGQTIHLPAPEITRLGLSNPLLIRPPVGKRLLFHVSDGPCTMKLWWKNGPTSF